VRKRTVRVFACLAATIVALVATPILASPAASAASTAAAPYIFRVDNAHYPAGGYCLDASSSNGVRLRLCDGTTFQQWIINGYEFRLNRYNQTLCLDGSTSNGIRLQPCNGTTFQQWYKPVGTDQIRLDRYDGTMCLDGSASNGIRLQTCNGTTFQDWRATIV
jgi:hypothetical protein